MGVFGAIGNALKKPVQAAGKVVGKAPGMGSVGKTVGKAPGMGMVGRGLGLGPSPAATPQMGQMAQNVGAGVGQMMPPPPPQPMPDQSQDMPPAMQQVPGQMGGGAMQGPMQNQEIRPDIMQAMKQKMMQQPGQPGVGGIGPSFGGQGIGRGPMMRNPRMM